MGQPSGIDGVTMNTDFENPTLTAEERALQSLSEEELVRRVNESKTQAPAAPPPPTPAFEQEPARVEKQREPVQAQQPEPEGPIVEQPTTDIPKKFQKPDGTLDEAKLDKSLQAINAKLSDYLTAEKELTATRHKRTEQPQGGVQPAPGQPQDTFLQRFKEDYAESPESAILRLANAIEQGTKLELMGEIQEIKNLLKLKDLTESNPEMLSQDTLTELKKIRAERPHLSWEDALDVHRGHMAKNTGKAGASQPKPQAPIMPGGISPTIQPATPSGVTLDKVNDLLHGKTSQEQEAILAKILPHR